MFKITLGVMLCFSVVLSDSMEIPLTEIGDTNTRKLDCVMSDILGIGSMNESVDSLNIKTSEDIEYFLKVREDETSAQSYSKGVVLDYIYRDYRAKEYYKNSIDLVPEHEEVAYNIAYFLARVGNTDSALSVLEKIKNISNAEDIAILKAYILIANKETIPHAIQFICKRGGLKKEKLLKKYNSCLKNKGF